MKQFSRTILSITTVSTTTKAQPFRIEIANTCKRELAFLVGTSLPTYATKVLDYGGRKWKNLHSNDNNLCSLGMGKFFTEKKRKQSHRKTRF